VIFAHKSTWRTQLLGAANLQPTKEVLQELLDIPEPKQMLRNTDRRDAVAIAGWAALHHKHIMEVDDEIDA